jgi:hypothetical protein
MIKYIYIKPIDAQDLQDAKFYPEIDKKDLDSHKFGIIKGIPEESLGIIGSNQIGNLVVLDKDVEVNEHKSLGYKISVKDIKHIIRIANTDIKNVGFDAKNGLYVNMFEAGIIDPAKVAISALKNAASISGMLLTTEALICEDEEPKENQKDPMGKMANMGMY